MYESVNKLPDKHVNRLNNHPIHNILTVKSGELTPDYYNKLSNKLPIFFDESVGGVMNRA